MSTFPPFKWVRSHENISLWFEDISVALQSICYYLAWPDDNNYLLQKGLDGFSSDI